MNNNGIQKSARRRIRAVSNKNLAPSPETGIAEAAQTHAEERAEAVKAVSRGKKKHLFSSLPVWKRATIIVIIIAEIILIPTIIIGSTLGKINHFSPPKGVKDNFDWSSVTNKDVMKDSNVSNILLIGQDTRNTDTEEKGNSDTMLIASINKKTKKITIVSLMRDMYVPIPSNGSHKLNAAYAYGGMQLLDATIEQNFGVHIDGNIEVNFAGFLDCLQIIGNVDVELNQEEADFLNATMSRNLFDDTGKKWRLKAGVNSMTPEQALAFARDRYTGNSDWSRTERQRKVIKAAFEKMKGSGLGTLMKIANKMLPYMSTDLSNSEMLGYVYQVAAEDMSLNTDHHLPVDGTFVEETINGQDVLNPDIAQNAAYLQKYLYGKTYQQQESSIKASQSADRNGTNNTDSKQTSRKTSAYSVNSVSQTNNSYGGGNYSSSTQSYEPSSVTQSVAPSYSEQPTTPPTEPPAPPSGGGEGQLTPIDRTY